MAKRFLSGNEAFAEGVRLARPQVISAYPITPQTTCVEALASMVESGALEAEYLHVESEHSALSAAIGASMAGARAFTATSSQGLLYMAECLVYASGGLYPIVMMNACRSTALPWNIYCDQRDSLLLADSGWIQAYAASAQEALDLALMSFAIAESPEVATPFMVCLDGFTLTHTYESVAVPESAQADAFLPPYKTENRFDFENPKNLAFSAGPETNYLFKHQEQQGMLNALKAVPQTEARFAQIFGRAYPGLTEGYLLEGAEYVLITLGTVTGIAQKTASDLRAEGFAAGVLRLRYFRPFPSQEIAKALRQVKAAAVIERDVSFGATGAVHQSVCAALQQQGITTRVSCVIAGLGGADISEDDLRGVFADLAAGRHETRFAGIRERRDER